MSSFFFFNDTATTEIYTLSLHDALPILTRLRPNCSALSVRWETWGRLPTSSMSGVGSVIPTARSPRSEEHTSELQSQSNLVCRLLLETKKDLRRASGYYSTVTRVCARRT